MNELEIERRVSRRYRTLTHGKVQGVTAKLLFQKRDGRDRLLKSVNQISGGYQVLRLNTHSSFANSQGFDTPNVLNGTFQRLEPGVVQIAKPPISGVIDRVL